MDLINELSNSNGSPYFPRRRTLTAQALPLILQQKLIRQLQQRNIPFDKKIIEGSLTRASSAAAVEEDYRQNHSYTANELEDELQRVAAGIHTTQRHLQATEESYYETTNAHGNIFSGWDGFIDNRDIANGNSLHSTTALVRRMPADQKWFSTISTMNNGGGGDHTSYPAVQSDDNDGKPIRVMTEVESKAMELQLAQAHEKATAPPKGHDTEEPTTEQDDDGNNNKEDQDENIDDNATTDQMADEHKKPDKKGKRKAAAAPSSTRPKRSRK